MQFPKKRVSDIFKIRDTGPAYLTPEGIKRLQSRLASLKQALPKYIDEAQRTAAYGDRSDNAEYKEAKAILRRTHRQIFSIEDKLKRAVAIASGRNAAGTVQMGSTVLLELPVRSGKEGIQKTFQILGPDETNPEKGRISYLSPLGAALINHKKGDSVTIQTPNSSQEYRILEIR